MSTVKLAETDRSADAEPIKRDAAAKPALVTAPPEDAAPASKPKSRFWRRLLIVSLPIALALGGGWVWLTGGRFATTDNAYIHQPIVQVTPEVQGRIASVEAVENKRVEAGAPLFRIDPEPLQIALDQAEAALAASRLSVDQLRAARSTAEVKLKSAQAISEVLQGEFERQRSLADRGVASSAALDDVEMRARAAEGDVALARAGVAAAIAALGGDPDVATDDVPAVRLALARRAEAARALAHVTVTAPVAGVVSQIDSLNVGQFVQPGMQVASLVQSDQTWVEANFKETQLGKLQSGQPVTIEVDAYPGIELDGEVESIGSATGSQFSLIPAQNATGNWVKVVQRVPVRISVQSDGEHPLRDGMSVAVSVDTGATRLDEMF